MMVIWRQYNQSSAQPCAPWLPQDNGALLLQQIQSMPRLGKKPIKYDEAMNAFGDYCLKFFEENHHDLNAWMSDRKLMEKEIAEAKEISWKLVEWLTQSGYWLELDGDEFEILEEGLGLYAKNH